MAQKKTIKTPAAQQPAKRKTHRQAPKQASTSGRNLWHIAGVLILTFLVFAQVMGFDFVNWDDPVNLLENPNLERFTLQNIGRIFSPATGTIIGNYNPLPIFTFAIEKAIFGLNPAVFHLNNLLLHLVCVYFVFRILQEMRLNQWAVLFGTMLFALHPMRVESVAWVTERKDVLFGAFYLAAILTYIQWLKRPDERRKWYIWTMSLFVVSLFAKIQAVTLPLSMLALDYWFDRPLKWKLIIEKIPFFALSLVFGMAGFYFLGEAGSLHDETNYTALERMLTGAHSLVVYVGKWIFPWEMAPLYPYLSELPTIVYFSPIGVALVLGVGIWAFLKKKKAIVFGLAFFIFNVMFLLQVVAAGQGYLADRFTYIPYLGLFFIMAYGYQSLLERYSERKNIVHLVASAYLLVLVVVSAGQTRIWKNGETLWLHAIKVAPGTDTPHQNLGKYYQTIDQKEKAMENFTKAINYAKNPAVSYNSRGKMLFDFGKVDLALADFEAAIAAGTTIGEIYINRGSAYARTEQYEKALADFNKGIELDPDYENGYLMRSLLYFTIQNYDAALKDHDKVLQMNPNNADVWYESGLTLNTLNRPAEALIRLNKAIEMKSGMGQFYAERARVHQKLGDEASAQADAQRASELGVKM
jgi:tetratricopeptide (TPR) repeat protein